MADSVGPEPTVFISHARSDSNVAERLSQELSERLRNEFPAARIWSDWAIEAGEGWAEMLRDSGGPP